MTIEQAKLLVDIYNALLQINTKGEDTVTMAECLVAFKSLLSQLEINNDKGGKNNA